MPVIKHVAIHVTPMRSIKYVINGDKTDECRLVKGINICTDAETAYEEFRMNFELHTGERFYRESLSENDRKTKIRLHHYIQSFSPGEITPEKANKLGVEFARKLFGEKFQVLVCTHTDREHVHNHILVSAFDFDGKQWHDNKTTINKAREISDRLAEMQGLSIIKNPKKGTMLPHNEYVALHNGQSWKEELRRQIDKLIVDPKIRTIQDLGNALSELGYEVSGIKYMHIKRCCDKNSKPMSTLKLGDGYGTEELIYRIEHKNFEMPISEIARYDGIQREYALCLRQIQKILYHSQESEKPHYVSYRTVLKNYELLCFLHEHKIHTDEDFRSMVTRAEENYSEKVTVKKKLEIRITEEEKILRDYPRFIELVDKNPMTKSEREELRKLSYLADCGVFSNEHFEEHKLILEKLRGQVNGINDDIIAAKSERDKLADYYNMYESQMKSEYDTLLEKAMEEQEAIEREERYLEEYEEELERDYRHNDYSR